MVHQPHQNKNKNKNKKSPIEGGYNKNYPKKESKWPSNCRAKMTHIKLPKSLRISLVVFRIKQMAIAFDFVRQGFYYIIHIHG